MTSVEPQKSPLVMSPDETRRLLVVASSLKVRVLLSLGYGCGLAPVRPIAPLPFQLSPGRKGCVQSCPWKCG